MQVRITAEPDEIEAFLVWLRERGATVSGPRSDRRYRNRSGTGERAYVTVELPTEPQE